MKSRESGSLQRKPDSRFYFYILPALLVSVVLAGCSIFKTRPTQEMSNTSAALKAAKEVQADVLAPVLYREATEWFQKAKAEYKLKNFQTAEEYALKARGFAEQAEFEVIKSGGQRTAPTEEAPPDAAAGGAPTPSPTPYDYPTPTPTPFSEIQNQEQNPGEPKTEASASPTPTSSDNSSGNSYMFRKKP